VLERDVSDASTDVLNTARAVAAAKHAAALSIDLADAQKAVEAVPVRHFLGGPCNQARCVVLMPLPKGSHVLDNKQPKQPREMPSSFHVMDSMEAACGTDLSEAISAWLSAAEELESLEQACRPPPEKKIRRSSQGSNCTQALHAQHVNENGLPQEDGPFSGPSSTSAEVPQDKNVGVSIGTVDNSHHGPVRELPRGRSCRGPSLLVFWGEAMWSRTQLLGEIVQHDWGLCSGNALDLEDLPGGRLWQRLCHEQKRPSYVSR